MAAGNFNGQIILELIGKMGRPATLTDILQAVSKETGLNSEAIQQPIQEALEGGCRLGFLHCVSGMYVYTPGSVIEDAVKNVPAPMCENALKTKTRRILENLRNQAPPRAAIIPNCNSRPGSQRRPDSQRRPGSNPRPHSHRRSRSRRRPGNHPAKYNSKRCGLTHRRRRLCRDQK